jgi:hypothetical protein
LVIAALLAGFTWFAWMFLPRDRSFISQSATVISQRPSRQGRTGRGEVYSVVTVRMADGRSLPIRRELHCQPQIMPGDTVKLIAKPIKSGGEMWQFAGRGCGL